MEQEEYARENITWTRIDYQDNQKVLDTLAIKPLNLLALIDEESNFPKVCILLLEMSDPQSGFQLVLFASQGTDATMLQKANQAIGSGGIYIPPKNSYETKFGIQHFAGIVHYDSKGIVFVFLTTILRGG